MKNIQLYVTKADYDLYRNEHWPEYQDFVNGAKSKDPASQVAMETLVRDLKAQGAKFPIVTDTACQSKWSWSTIYLNKLSTSSCHRVDPVKFDIEDFDNFHNLPKKLEDRKLMLAGKWPSGGCEYCRDIELSGGFSDRHHNLGIRGLTPIELETDPTAVSVTPRIVEIFAQNTCNLACVYCNSYLSSKIESENKKFGGFYKKGVMIPVYPSQPDVADEYFVKFLEWLPRNIHGLRRLHLLGGETFLQHRLLEGVLGIIEKYPNPELEFCIFSNLMVPDAIWSRYMTQIERLQRNGHIKVFDLTASIDCWGEPAEYARHGLVLDEFEEKFKWAAEQNGSWMTLYVNQTITPLTIKTMPELIEKINQYSNGKHIAHFWEMYVGPNSFMHPNIFSYKFWEEDFGRIFSVMPDTNAHQHDAVERMQGIQTYLKQFTENNTKDIERLRIYLDELDRRRGTNWRKVFPYLEA